MRQTTPLRRAGNRHAPCAQCSTLRTQSGPKRKPRAIAHRARHGGHDGVADRGGVCVDEGVTAKSQLSDHQRRHREARARRKRRRRGAGRRRRDGGGDRNSQQRHARAQRAGSAHRSRPRMRCAEQALWWGSCARDARTASDGRVRDWRAGAGVGPSRGTRRVRDQLRAYDQAPWRGRPDGRAPRAA
jgi:hypothetical protein